MKTAQKPCCTCKEVKPLTEFYKDRGQADGLEWRCKVCRKKSANATNATHGHKYVSKKAVWGRENRKKCRSYEKEYYDRNKIDRRGMFRAKINRRRGMIKYATPTWVDRAAIELIYQNCPGGKAVDHIVPLDGFNPDGVEVCGLHVPWNLQYLTFAENGIKGRRFDPKGGTNYMKGTYRVTVEPSNPKLCSSCRLKLPLEMFHRDKARKDGYEYKCKACKKESDKKSKSKNPELYASLKKNWALDNPEKVREIHQKQSAKRKLDRNLK